MSLRWRRGPALVGLVFTLLFALFGSEAYAQNTTGTIRGRVLNEAGTPVADAQVVARNVGTNVARTTVTNAQGAYMLVGLAPASYELSVNVIGYQAPARQVRVLIGQTLAMDLQLQPQAIVLEGITAVGERVHEVKTPEIATNVTEEQISSLPQQERNFLNFAGLAPGITVSRSEDNKNITAGGLPATKINVFVDGASFKNDVLEGGVHGQDASKGNPFPQIAIQEFRVITQNFKAEYQRAASAIVTATTKSGTNDFKMNGFVLGQPRDFVERNPGAVEECDRLLENDPNATRANCAPKPQYERWQVGLSAGGPIMQDRLHYFAAFEGNYQDRAAIVGIGRADEFRNMVIPGDTRTFGSFDGQFDSPFRSNLGVAKLSYIPGENQTLDLSWNGRFETDKRGFSGQTSFEAGENVKISYNVLTLTHGMTRSNWRNQAMISAQRSTWNPTVENEGAGVGRVYEGILRVGGRSTEQKFVQDRVSLRNDLTRFGIEWGGAHAFKGGVNVDFLNYDVQKRFNGNPEFVFTPITNQGADTLELSLLRPTRAFWGAGDPGMEESNVQFGAYIQDDWDVSDKLQVNLGVRWDAETNMFNNEWVTPDSIRTRVGPVLSTLGYDPENYFTSGRDDRPIYLGAFQPRVGFSYDLFGDSRTVVHGGFGVYYDREIWNHLLDERFRLNWVYRNFDFATGLRTGTDELGQPIYDNSGIAWDPSYLSATGLQPLVDDVNPFVTGEVFVLKNDSKPPKSNQWSVGVRQSLQQFVLGATYRGVRGSNLTSWYCAKAHSEHGYCEGTREAPYNLPYNILMSTDEGKTKYDAIDLTFEKPFTAASRWGFTFAYTGNLQAERKGMDFFTLEFPDVRPEEWPWIDSGIEKHRVSASAIIGLPYEFRFSTMAQWGSGLRFSERDETIGWGPRRVEIDWYANEGPSFRQVDLRLEKQFLVPGTPGQVGLLVEALNVFNHDNYRNFQEFSHWGGGAVNDNYRQPELWSADAGRRLQLGVNFAF